MKKRKGLIITLIILVLLLIIVGINNEGIRDREIWFLVPSCFYLISNSSCFSLDDRILN